MGYKPIRFLRSESFLSSAQHYCTLPSSRVSHGKAVSSRLQRYSLYPCNPHHNQLGYIQRAIKLTTYLYPLSTLLPHFLPHLKSSLPFSALVSAHLNNHLYHITNTPILPSPPARCTSHYTHEQSSDHVQHHRYETSRPPRSLSRSGSGTSCPGRM